jgi:phosphotransferase system  glucose/maltose/N-acetylglucosamine-specific IIC component
MDFDKNFVIALLCGVVSMFLSTIMPCVLKSSTNDLLVDARKVYEANRQVIVVSSVIVVITAYLALSLYPLFSDNSDSSFDDDNVLERLVKQLPSSRLV